MFPKNTQKIRENIVKTFKNNGTKCNRMFSKHKNISTINMKNTFEHVWYY